MKPIAEIGLSIALLLFSGLSLFAQNLASNCIACDGAYSIETNAEVDEIFVLLEGIPQETIANPILPLLYENMCVGSYTFQLMDNGALVEEQSYFMATPLANPGQAQLHEMCASDATVDLVTLLSPEAMTSGSFYFGGNEVANNWVFALPITYDFEYTITDGACVVSIPVQVVVNEPPFPGLTTTHLICEDYFPFPMLGQLQGDAANGQPDAGGSWTDSDGNLLMGTYFPSTGMEGAYTYTIDNVGGCAAVSSVLIVQEIELPNSGEDTEITVCETAPLFLMTDVMEGDPVDGGQWFAPDNSMIDGILDPSTMPEGEYRYTVNGTSVCPQGQSFLTVNYSPVPNAGENSATTLCSHLAPVALLDELDGNPNAGGTWTYNGQATDDLFDPSVDQAGSYSYLVQAVGCPDAQATLDVTVEQGPQAGPDVQLDFCANGEAYLLNDFLHPDAELGNWTDASGEPSNAQTSSLITQTETFMYEVNTANCGTATAQYDVQWTAAPTLDMSVEELCADGSILELADFAVIEGNATVAFINSATGLEETTITTDAEAQLEYAIQLLPTSACPVQTIPWSLALLAPTIAPIQIADTVCSDLESINLSDWSDQFPADGFWADQDGNPMADAQNIAGAANFEFTFLHQEVAVCPAIEHSFALAQVERPYAGAPFAEVFCQLEETIDLFPLLGAAQPNGIWSDEGGVSDGMVDISQPGIFELLYTVEGAGTCPSDEAAVVCEVLEQPQVALPNNIDVCFENFPIFLAPDSISTFSYQWSGADEVEGWSNAELEFMPANPLDTWQLVLQAANGQCEDADTVVVTLLSTVPIALSSTTGVCAGESTSMSLPDGLTNIAWQPAAWFDDPAGQEVQLTPAASGEVTVTAESADGCVSMASSIIEQLPIPVLEVTTEDAVSCPPVQAQLSVSSESDLAGVHWLLEDELQGQGSTLSIEESLSGIYMYEAVGTSSNGCQSQAVSVLVQVLEQASISFTHQPAVISTSITDLDFAAGLSNAAVWNWNLEGVGENADFFNFDFGQEQGEAVEVCLWAMSADGCENEVCEIIPFEEEVLIFIPTAFTPDQDGVNEVFRTVTAIELASFDFRIYDRWGNEVFHSQNPDKVWIGNVQGGDHYAENGVYAWHLKALTFGGVRVEKRGSVSLIR